MKKMLALIFAVVMVMGLLAGCSVQENSSDAGVPSSEKETTAETTTAVEDETTAWDKEEGVPSPGAAMEDLYPILTEASSAIVELYSTEEVEAMAEEILDLMAAAKEALEAACPESYAVKYFFYLDILIDQSVTTAEFEPIEHAAIIFKQYVDGAWIEMDHAMREDGVLTVSGVVEAPVAIFTR